MPSPSGSVCAGQAPIGNVASPQLDLQEAAGLLEDLYGMDGVITELPSHSDRNFRIDAGALGRFVFKVAHADQDEQRLQTENQALLHLSSELPGVSPELVPTIEGRIASQQTLTAGTRHWVRLITLLDGEVMASVEPLSVNGLQSFGHLLGSVSSALGELPLAPAYPPHRWDLSEAEWTVPHLASAASSAPSALAAHGLLECARRFVADGLPRLGALPQTLLHGDANDHNVLCQEGRATGLIDFGDITQGARILDLAIACAYGVFRQADPLHAIGSLSAGFHQSAPLTRAELEALLPCVGMRLVQSVVISHLGGADESTDSYRRCSEAPAWHALAELGQWSPKSVLGHITSACSLPIHVQADADPEGELSVEGIQSLRHTHLGPSLSTAYTTPLLIQRGQGAYLFDELNRPYLDCVNNVCHVGHCHPGPQRAAAEQSRILNTNTRYLHPNLVRLAERLSALMPDPLSVCFFVNSGSEAGELALRMARAATGRRGVLSVEGGYHGNTTSMVDISHYKHNGPGGTGPPDWVSTIPLPDPFRGPYAGPHSADRYAMHIREASQRLQNQGHEPAAFFAEPLIGCGGQIVPPQGWLAACYREARKVGALCVADEVQVGLGRVGSHWWAFEQAGASPDIVTLGKPMGNGHPIAAVVTTPEVAQAFSTGMEYFNTFGGNPVSCATALAVLDVIEQEGLREQAANTGARLLSELRSLAQQVPAMGSVRGLGLYIGIEWVIPTEPGSDQGPRPSDHSKAQTCGAAPPPPDPRGAAELVELLRDRGILLSTDGPHNNVLKIKPPLCFGPLEVDLLISNLRQVLLRERCDS